MLFQPPKISLQVNITVLIYDLAFVPISRLSLSTPYYIFLIRKITLLPLLYLIAREARSLEPFSTLLLPACAVA